MISPPAAPVVSSVVLYPIYTTAATVDARAVQNVLTKAKFVGYNVGPKG
jgi:hypothetical protein